MGVTKRTRFVDENERPVEDAVREAVLGRDAVTVAPVEVSGKDVRTLPLPATMEPVASATPELPYIPPKEKPVKVNATLRFGHRRYKVLTKHITAFLGRLDKWAPPFSINTEPFLEEWGKLGGCLDTLVDSGANVRITESSKRRSWLEPGAHVELRKDVAAEFLSVYSQEELEALEVVKVLPTKALLKTGTREAGLVPLAHIQKPSRTL
jgi:hypothetical protein